MNENTVRPFLGNTPLIEVVLGIHFRPVRDLNPAHVGRLWGLLSGAWDTATIVPPLPPTGLDISTGQQGISPALLETLMQPSTHHGLVRLRNDARGRMLQIQNGRYHYNWIRTRDELYPGFQGLRSECIATWDEIKQVTAKHSHDPLIETHWELTYVNHLDTPALAPCDASAQIELPTVPPHLPEYLSSEGLDLNWRFRIVPLEASLDVSLKSARKQEHVGDEKSVIVMNLTARGRLSDDGADLPERGLTAGHDAILKAFRDLTTKQAREHWRVES